jgi:hypothetical protein
MALDYKQAMRAPFEQPQWPLTLLWVTLAGLVPFIGPVVAFGYQSTVTESVARGSSFAQQPPFVIEHLVDYLLRGVRLFVVSLLVAFVVAPVAFVILVVGMATSTALLGQQTAATSLLGTMAALSVVVGFLALVMAVMTLVAPLWVRAALDPDLGGLLDGAWMKDFLRRVGKESLLLHLFLLVLNLGLMIVGVLSCFVGIFPAMGYSGQVHAQLLGQLYALYVERGGRPILPAAPAVIPA